MIVRQFTQRTWSSIVSSILLPVGDWVFGQKMMKRFRFLENAQWWDRDRIESHRDTQLVRLVETAYYEVPFYRRIMDQSRVKPRDIRRAEDLSKLPIVDKEMLRSGYPDRTTRYTGQKTHDSCTSGSTGTNFCVKEDAWTAGWYRASFLLCLNWAGWRIGEPHVQTGMTLNRSLDRRLKDMLLRCHYVSAFDLRDEKLDESLERLERYDIRHLWGYPGSLYYLARRAQEKGYNRALRSVVTWGDTVYPRYRETIEDAFDAQIYDTYGCAEGMHISAQCGSDGNYHVHSLDVFVEYLDADGNPVPSGKTGDLVVTRLHPGPMPLIRYRLGDRATNGSAELCCCGRGFEVMRSIQGRDTDCVITPSGNRLIVHFFTGVIEHFAEVDSFQVIQHERDSMQLRLVPRGGYSGETEKRIVAALTSKGAADMRIEVETVPEIAISSSGKRRFVVRNVEV